MVSTVVAVDGSVGLLRGAAGHGLWLLGALAGTHVAAGGARGRGRHVLAGLHGVVVHGPGARGGKAGCKGGGCGVGGEAGVGGKAGPAEADGCVSGVGGWLSRSVHETALEESPYTVCIDSGAG